VSYQCAGAARLTWRITAASRVAAAVLTTVTAIETTTIKKLDDHAASIESKLFSKAATFPPPKDAGERNAYARRQWCAS
jgi:hypothetical protein